jgi:hypothetical protein
MEASLHISSDPPIVLTQDQAEWMKNKIKIGKVKTSTMRFVIKCHWIKENVFIPLLNYAPHQDVWGVE